MVATEVMKGWKVLVGTILVYVMGYPGTILIVVPSLLNLHTNVTVSEGKDFRIIFTTVQFPCSSSTCTMRAAGSQGEGSGSDDLHDLHEHCGTARQVFII